MAWKEPHDHGKGSGGQGEEGSRRRYGGKEGRGKGRGSLPGREGREETEKERRGKHSE